MAKRKFYEGQVIDGKIVKEVFRNMSGSHYYITFTDGSNKIYNFK
jgi:hypothetical protein